MRFDWYSATFEGVDQLEVEAGLGELAGAVSRPTRPLFGYTDAVEIVRGDDRLAVVMSGSRTGETFVSVT